MIKLLEKINMKNFALYLIYRKMVLFKRVIKTRSFNCVTVEKEILEEISDDRDSFPLQKKVIKK